MQAQSEERHWRLPTRPWRVVLAAVLTLGGSVVHVAFSRYRVHWDTTVLFVTVPAVFVVAVSLVWPRWHAPFLVLLGIYGGEFLSLRGRLGPSVVERVLDGKGHLLLIPAGILVLGLATVKAYRMLHRDWQRAAASLSGPFLVALGLFLAAITAFCIYLYRTPISADIFEAARFGRLRGVRIFLARGTDVDARDRWGNTALYYAVGYSGAAEVVEYLLARGADVSAHDEMGNMPLHWAINARVATLLLDAGAEVDATNRNRESALYSAAKRGDAALCELLFARGADVGATNHSGMTALHAAAEGAWYERGPAQDFRAVAELLLQYGADVNAPDRRNNTPLHHAALSGHVPVARLLLQRGADPHARNSSGKTPPQVAREYERKALIEFLRRQSAE